MKKKLNEIKQLLKYIPETGEFFWRVDRGGKAKAGTKAGWKNKDGYIHLRLFGKVVKAHRVAYLLMTGQMPKDQIDHINHIRHDNRWCNLREADPSTNQKNRKRNKNNKSGFVGVRWNKRNKNWLVRIKVKGKDKYLGSFDSKEEAIKCRVEANKIYQYHKNHGNQMSLEKESKS